QLCPETIEVAKGVLVPLDKECRLDDVRPLRRILDLGAESRVERVSQRDHARNVSVDGREGTYPRPHRLSRGADWQPGALLSRESNRTEQVIHFRRQFP